jgi:hypothetical protein
MLPLGLSTDYKPVSPLGGFLTWAAKPSVRESPDPAIDIRMFFGQITPTGHLLALRNYVLPAIEVPFPVAFFMLSHWTTRDTVR